MVLAEGMIFSGARVILSERFSAHFVEIPFSLREYGFHLTIFCGILTTLYILYGRELAHADSDR